MFTTVANLKALLGIPTSDTTQDTLLTLLVAAANRVVLDIFGLTSAASTAYTDKIDIDDSSTAIVMTRKYPLISVTSVTELGEALAATEYSSNEHGAVKLLGDLRYWAYGRESVVIVYEAGWTTVPDDLVYATTLIAAYGYNTAARAGLASEKIGQYSYELSSGAGANIGASGGFGIPPEAERILSSWRRVFTLPN